MGMMDYWSFTLVKWQQERSSKREPGLHHGAWGRGLKGTELCISTDEARE